MIRRALLYFVVLVILLLAVISASQWDKDTALLQDHAQQVSSSLGEKTAEAFAWIDGHDLTALPDAAALEPVAAKPYTILALERDSLLFWSNTLQIPDHKTLQRLATQPEPHLLDLPSGQFLAASKPKGALSALVLVPVQYQSGSDPDIVFVDKPNDFPVTVNGKAIAWLEAARPLHSAFGQGMKLGFGLLMLVVLLAFLSSLAAFLEEKNKPVAALAVPLLAGAGILVCDSLTGFSGSQFAGLPLFRHPFSGASLLGDNLGVWLLHVAIAGWMMVFFNRQMKPEMVDNLPDGAKKGFTVAAYLGTFISLLLTAQAIRHLSLQGGINLDFDNILRLNGAGWAAVLGIMALALAFFLFNFRLNSILATFQLPNTQRYTYMGIAGVLGIACCFVIGNWPSGILLPALFGLTGIFIFDAFAHWESPGFGWVVIWLLYFSLFSATFFHQFTQIKNRNARETAAIALTTVRDTAYAEKDIPVIVSEMSADTGQLGTLLKPWPFKADVFDLEGHLNNFVFRRNYVFQHYRLHVYAFDKDNQPLLRNQAGDLQFVLHENWEKGVAIPEHGNIRYHVDQEGKFRYMAQLRANRMSDPSQPATVYCFFDHEYPAPTHVYARLFFNTPYKKLDQLNEFDFAVWQNGRLVVERGHDVPGNLDAGLPNGSSKIVETETPARVDAIAKSADGATVAVVGRKTGGWTKLIYLFSLLFTLASIVIFLLALSNGYLRFLPDTFRFGLSTSGSLERRIHFGSISLIGVAFVVIGIMTYRYFSDATIAGEQENLDFRANAVLAHLKNQVLNSGVSADSLQKNLQSSLSNMASSLSMDANLYNEKGDLLFTTQQDLNGLGILPSKMNAVAFADLRKSGLPDFVAFEQHAGYPYSTKYMPLRTGANQLLGFLGVPYQLTGHKPGQAVADFMGILASLYVFLLLLAYVITFLLARSIIKPVSLISDKIRQLRLEDKNEPLEYKGDNQDELSALIVQYNHMVHKLEESKVQLIRLEREGAWREMARQVAHDIKNPLTTMKLSMQQLERVSSDPEQAAAYLRKAITRLIEQIDSLAQIASEFSMFANLDIRQKNEMVLNEVVESVHDLFSEQKNVDLNLTLPAERFRIMGDKNHLIRVFNNLVINAIQAIPSDRRGQIAVSLYRNGKNAVVKISDNGGGIPVEIRQRVFEPNFTTKTSGSGLGLAICKKIIEAHDGDIYFETRDNEGTDFFVEMPVL